MKSPENHHRNIEKSPELPTAAHHRHRTTAFGFHPLEEAVNHRHGETDRILALAMENQPEKWQIHGKT